MLEQQLTTLLRQKIEIEKIEEVKESSAELIDEVGVGVEGFLTLIAVCEGSFWLIVSVGLLFTLPLLSPVGMVFIIRLIGQYRMKLGELRGDFEG